ncbi:hypothetical protein [Microbacterium invictum]|uniref:DUF58 domain-containing protein n=1 Tax=Microbacterium invictum TaxID=515415 RepID=A0ABZ0VFA1_9MICO|nr:hypothetical protein [Microbacterium invictum]WQB71341.1 hypothetical protein T9R20_05070 [Microbacterium invictum]
MDVGWWALIISGASLLISAATFWRNRTPAPRWVTGVKVKGPDTEGEVRVTATAENRGRGVARDVRFEQVGDSLMSAFSRETRKHAEFGERLSITLIYQADAAGDGRFRLTWSQEPNLHRRRTRVLRFRLQGGGGELPRAKHDIGVY